MANQALRLDALDVTESDATANSVPISMKHMSRMSVQVETSGAGLIGTLVLEQLNEEHDPDRAALSTNWQDTGVALDGTNDDFDNIENVNARWIRVRWTFGSGTGRKVVTVMAKNV